MKRFFTILLGLFFFSHAFATHNRAGEIRYRVINYLTFQVTIITYTKESSTQADRDTLTLNWGDGTFEQVLRSNGPPLGGVPQGVSLGHDIKYNEYKSGLHTYPGPLPFYIISVADPNRISNIININNGNSVNIQFYIEDTLRIFNPTFVGLNNSPILLYPPIDNACVGDTFFHNPTAFDPDGDSLSYEFQAPLSDQGFPVPNYQYPDEVSPGVNNHFTINPVTGEVIWATPQREGIYNIAILVTEWRNGIKIGTVLRDMQIIVSVCGNDPPQIVEFADTCVVAGSLIRKFVHATDPDTNPTQTVTLSAEGGPLRLTISRATFTNPPPQGNPDVTGLFRWQTDCHHIRRQFYEVVFKAEDSFSPNSLVDLKTWIIRVIAPAPENLVATAQGKHIDLTWDNPYYCDSISDFIGFSIWRREGSNPFAIDTCTTGLAGRGYTKIASNVTDFTYTDNNVNHGRSYCYRILAEFAQRTQSGLFYNKVESLPSNESCAELKRDLPVIKNVSVTQTDQIAGKIFVAWYRPIANAANLDTTQLSGPYTYKLYRSNGFIGANFTEIVSFSSQFFGSLLDTTFMDTQLNTVDNAYSYQVRFFADGDSIGGSDIASSVFLSIKGLDNKLELNWVDSVPWLNYQYVVFRQNKITTGFDSIATVAEKTYTNDSLTNDSLYCYYVMSVGEYSSQTFDDTLLNNSQQVCERPKDTIPPCPPFLTVTNNCNEVNDGDVCSSGSDAFQNNLSWKKSNAAECDPEITQYRVYYSEPDKDSLVLIYTALGPADTFYIHSFENSLAGCYAVTAIDSFNNESVYSNKVCVDNCPCYKLPNVFTPNNDGHNDYYTPILPYRFIEKVDMKIYNRWGTLVFETSDPLIHWDGNDINNGKAVKDGVYYYVCTVYEIRVEGIRKNSNILNGFIHVIHGK